MCTSCTSAHEPNSAPPYNPDIVDDAESIGRVTLRRADYGQNGRSVFYVSCGHYNTKIVVVRSPAASDTHTLSHARQQGRAPQYSYAERQGVPRRLRHRRLLPAAGANAIP